jgi:hypothetical protein
MRITEAEKFLIWHLLFSIKNCFKEDGNLKDEYYKTLILPDLTKEEKKLFDNLVKDKLLF